MDLNRLADDIHKNAINHGWWEEPKPSFGDICSLIHCEISEAYEEYRKGKKENEIYWSCKKYENEIMCDGECTDCEMFVPKGITIELADALMRILDYCAAKEIDIEDAILKKMHYNRTRTYKHGGKIR